MKRIGEHQQVNDYLNQVCAYIKASELHAEIKLELENHLDEIVEAKMNEGIAWEEAISQAIRQLGDPQVLGKQLHDVHKPKVEWNLLGLLLAFIGIGLTAMYAVQLSDSTIQYALFESQTVKVGLGLLLLVGLYFWDYRKLKSFAWPLYFVTVLVMLLTVASDRTINSRPWLDIGSTIIDVSPVTPYLFLISLAGIMSAKRWTEYSFVRKFLQFIVIPAILYHVSVDYDSFILYSLGFLALTFFQKKNWMEFWAYLASQIVAHIAVIVFEPQYRIYRWISFLDLSDDPLGKDYEHLQSIQAIKSAGFWGHGFGANIEKTADVPVIWTDHVFTYLIFSLGWVMGLVILLAIAIFLLRIARVVTQVSDPYGKLLAIGLTTILAVSFFWNVLKAVGLSPVSGVTFPFISYGGTHLLFECAAIGLILSAYRRKDMIKQHPGERMDVKAG